MMILRTLFLGPTNGYQVAKTIERMSDEVLQVDHSSLYPALHRLEKKGWLSSKWDNAETNRRSKSYRLTALGRKQLLAETSKWEKLSAAIPASCALRKSLCGPGSNANIRRPIAKLKKKSPTTSPLRARRSSTLLSSLL